MAELTDFNKVTRYKERSLPRLRQILETFIGSSDFKVDFTNNVKSEFIVIPGNELSSDIETFKGYYHVPQHRFSLNVKALKGEYSDRKKDFMFDRFNSKELSYLIIDFAGNSMVIEIGELLIDIINKSRTTSNFEDKSSYYPVDLKEVAKAGIIKYSDYDGYDRPVLKSSYSSKSKQTKDFNICLRDYLGEKTRHNIGVENREITEHLKKFISENFYVPLWLPLQHYRSESDDILDIGNKPREEHRNMIEEIIWRYLRRSVELKYIKAFEKTKNKHLYFWNFGSDNPGISGEIPITDEDEDDTYFEV